MMTILSTHIVKLPDTAVCNNTVNTKQGENRGLLFTPPLF